MVFSELLAMLIVILIAAEVFTNALEHLGEKLGISEGVTGSLFAAVGTALPETMVPVLALMAGTQNVTTNEEIGVGAILGAPLMLATLSTCLMAISVWKRRGSLYSSLLFCYARDVYSAYASCRARYAWFWHGDDLLYLRNAHFARL